MTKNNKSYCKNCKYKKCITGYTDIYECQNKKIQYVELIRETPRDGIGYSDYEGYKASLYVGANFGCIHYEDKEQMND